jgi:TP901 family phage tail tape measure protein
MSFLSSAFETVVVFSAIDNLTGQMQRMGASMGILDEQTKATQATLNNFKSMAFIGGGLTLAGVVMAKGLANAADEAGNLQMAMMGVKTALGLNNDEFQKAMNMSQTMGIPTQFSAQQVGGIMATAANAGLSKSSVLDPSIMQQYVNFSDVQAFGTKHEDPNDAIANAVKMTNLAQITGTQDTSTYLDQLNAALMHTTDTASEFATNMKYYTGTAQKMGISSSTILTDNAWLSRMGLGGGKGGMAMQDFLSRSIYGSSGKKADDAMQTAGFVVNGRSVFEDAKGAFVGIPAASKILQDFGQRFHGDAATMLPLLKDIFGVPGEKVAMAMSTSAGADQYTNVQQQMQDSASVNDTQKALNETWIGQTAQMTSTLKDIWTNFGFGVAGSMLPLLGNLNDFLAKILLWEQAHPEVMKWIATFTEIAAAVLLVVGPITLLSGVIGYLSTAEIVGTGFKLLGSAIGGAAAPVLGLIAAGYLLYQAWTDDWGGIKEKTQAVTDWISQEIPKAGKNIEDLGKDLGIINSKGDIEIPGWLKATIGGIGSAIVIMKGLEVATLAWNILADANPWVLTLSVIALAVMGIITHWDDVKKAVQGVPPWVVAVGAAIASALVWMNAMKIATIAWNLLTAANPWLVLLAAVSTAIILIVTNWKQVTQAINDAKAAMDNFMGTNQPAQEKQGENAWTQYNNNTLPAPNPNATLVPTPHNPWANPLSSLQSWVQGKAYASGTNYAPGGMSLVGENGPEILNIPTGSRVIPNHKLGDLIPQKDNSGTSYGDTYIDIHPTPNQSAKEIAQEVAKIFGTGTRSNNMSRSMGPNRFVPG